ncbi:hypothetical protein G6514_001790 [Epicoccum nigrum]|nr:hypothetical protein G6514_001790 [Epicoccum nigrum]
MRVDLNLKFLGQQTIEFRRRFFRKWMAVFTAEQHQVNRKVRVYDSDAREDMDGFWDDVAKLDALEKLVLIVDAHEPNAMMTIEPFIMHYKDCVYGAMYPRKKDYNTTPTTPTTVRNQQDSPLLRLPTKIRDIIFGYVIESSGNIQPLADSKGILRLPPKFKEVMRTGQTCRQLRVETYVRYLSQQTFDFQQHSFQQHLSWFLAEQRALIRKVRVYREDAEAYNFWYAAGSMRSLESFVVVLDGDEDWGSAVRELSRGLGIVIGRQVEVAVAQLDYVWRSGPGWESLGHGRGQRGGLNLRRNCKSVVRVARTCRQIRAETYLRFLSQQTTVFRRRSFMRSIALFGAEPRNAIRKLRVYQFDLDAAGFWEAIGTLGSLEHFALVIHRKETNREDMISFCQFMLNSVVVGHRVEFEALGDM